MAIAQQSAVPIISTGSIGWAAKEPTKSKITCTTMQLITLLVLKKTIEKAIPIAIAYTICSIT